MASLRNIHLSHRTFARALAGIHEVALKAAHGIVRKVAGSPGEAGLMMGQLQEALGELEKNEREPGVMVAPNHPMVAGLQSYLTEQAAQQPERLEPVPQVGGQGEQYEVKFDTHDALGWAESFFTWWRGLKKHAWMGVPTSPEPLPEKVRIAVLGDWGTGLYGAPACATSIDADPGGYALAVHLGDVYYSGTPREERERFLSLWPKKPAVSRALNSNHEMYTGGYGYFDETLKQFGQRSSPFWMESPSWVLVGLDTGYHEHDLSPDQVQLVQRAVEGAQGRRVILFSHHQPYSMLDAQGPLLQQKLWELLERKQLFAWYWGHEHRCAVYDRHPGWELYGRCIGHSGFPYFRPDFSRYPTDSQVGEAAWKRLPARNLVPGGLFLDGPNPYIQGHETQYGPNGYMTLELDGPHLLELHRLPDGTAILKQELA